MRTPLSRTLAAAPGRLLLAVVALAAWPALAQEVEASAPARTHPSGEIFGAKIRYGVVLREGGQEDQGPGITYDGLTPNDIAIQLGWFPIDKLGVELAAQREAFGLFGEGGRVTGGSLLRGHLGPKGRIRFGPLRLELVAAFQYAQLPAFASSVQPELRAGTRAAVLLASRVIVDLPAGFNVQARGEYPLGLSARDGAGQPARSSGFAGGGGIGYALGNADRLTYGVLVDYSYVSDRLDSESGASARQTLQRIGANVTFDWLDAPPPPPPPKYGGLLVSVLDADSGAPLGPAKVVLQQEDEDDRPLQTAADGTVAVAELPPGPWVARVSVGGYLPAEGRAAVVAGQNGRLEVRAKKEPPKVGGLLVTVTNKEGGAPVEGAVVVVADRELLTAADGTVKLDGLKPGAVEVKVAAKGFREALEAASITAGRTSQLPVELIGARKKVLATLTGLVRNKRGGGAVGADLEVPELKLKTKADAQGAFTMRVPGGTYSVIISAPGFITQQKTVVVKEGDQAIFNVDLFPKRGR